MLLHAHTGGSYVTRVNKLLYLAFLDALGTQLIAYRSE